MKYDVVIAGGGFGGAYCARTLGKALGAAGVRRVALIAERNVLVFHPMLAEVAGSALTSYDVVNPLRQFCRRVDVLQGNIQRIEWAGRRLHLDGGRFTRDHVVEFRHLVLALGSVTDLSRVPGMADYGWPMKSVADALRLRSAIINRLEEANLVEDPEKRARLLTFIVVGGGYTGVETAGQLLDLLREVQPLYVNLRSPKTAPARVVLVHSRAHLLEEIGEKLGDYAQRVLEKRGMEIRLKTRVAEVTAGKVIFEDGGFIEAHTVITSIGNSPNPIVVSLCRQIGLAMPANGRIPVEPTMRVAGQPDLWAIGDCAQVPWFDRGEQKFAPPTAQFAVRQGKQLGANIARVLRAGDDAGSPASMPALRPFTYRYMGQLATVGEREAVAEVFGIHFSGFIAWFMWRSIYLAKLPSIFKRLRVTIDWTFDLFFRRDISVVAPPPEEDLRSIHLEAGEPLFMLGDSCRAFYYVRSGSITLARPGEPARVATISAGIVIDHEWLAADNRWTMNATAAESSDLVVFRGRALDLFKHELRLVRRSPGPAQRHEFRG